MARMPQTEFLISVWPQVRDTNPEIKQRFQPDSVCLLKLNISSPHSPFFGFEPGRGVSRNEEERAHGVHVTEGWKERRKVTSGQINRHTCLGNVDSRGAPSAISMAVMPQDHRSLCKAGQQAFKTIHAEKRLLIILLCNHMLHLGSHHKR